MRKATVLVLGSVTTFLVFLAAWDTLVIKPREAFMLKVMECTGDDTSQEAWDFCTEHVRSTM